MHYMSRFNIIYLSHSHAKFNISNVTSQCTEQPLFLQALEPSGLLIEYSKTAVENLDLAEGARVKWSKTAELAEFNAPTTINTKQTPSTLRYFNIKPISGTSHLSKNNENEVWCSWYHKWLRAENVCIILSHVFVDSLHVALSLGNWEKIEATTTTLLVSAS